MDTLLRAIILLSWTLMFYGGLVMQPDIPGSSLRDWNQPTYRVYQQPGTLTQQTQNEFNQTLNRSINRFNIDKNSQYMLQNKHEKNIIIREEDR